MKKVTIRTIAQKKSKGEKLVMMTAYDFTFARILDEAGADLLLVGDSLGNVIQGQSSTLPVTVDHIVYHTAAVSRGAQRAHVVADMPFLSYHISPEEALRAAGRMMAEGGAHSVKLEGGAEVAPTVARIVQAGIPVMGHVGLTPQSVHQLGGFVVQGKTDAAAAKLLADAKALEAAGAYAVVLEAVPAEVAAEVTEALSIPTIGIGAGVGCDGQVLVCYDLLGLNPDFKPRFVKRYVDGYGLIRGAAEAFAAEVREGSFPTEGHSFHQDPKVVTDPEDGKLAALYGG